MYLGCPNESLYKLRDMKKLIIALIALGLFGCESPGRYQLVMGADVNEGTVTYLVDTKTGRVWRKDLDKHLSRFFPIPFALDENSLSPLSSHDKYFIKGLYSLTPSNTWGDFWKNRHLKKESK